MNLSVILTFLAVSGLIYSVPASSARREKRFLVDDLKHAFDTVKDKVNDVVNDGKKDVNIAVGDVKHTADDVTGKIKDKVDDVVNNGKKDVNIAVGDVKNTVNDVTGKIQVALNKAGKGFTKFTNQVNKDIYDDAEETFNNIKELEGKIDFKEAVNALLPLLDSAVTDVACELICEASADAIFGPEVEPVFFLACPPVCEAALAELEDLAEG